MRNIRKFETFEDFLASQESVSGSGKYVQDIKPGFVYVKERYEDGTYAFYNGEDSEEYEFGDVIYYDGTPTLKKVYYSAFTPSMGEKVGLVVVPTALSPDGNARIMAFGSITTENQISPEIPVANASKPETKDVLLGESTAYTKAYARWYDNMADENQTVYTCVPGFHLSGGSESEGRAMRASAPGSEGQASHYESPLYLQSYDYYNASKFSSDANSEYPNPYTNGEYYNTANTIVAISPFLGDSLKEQDPAYLQEELAGGSLPPVVVQEGYEAASPILAGKSSDSLGGGNYNAFSDFSGYTWTYGCPPAYNGGSETQETLDSAAPSLKSSKPVSGVLGAYFPHDYVRQFYTDGTQQGDWYLPSMGEMGFVVARYKKILEIFNYLVSVGAIVEDGTDNIPGLGIDSDSSQVPIWTSTVGARMGGGIATLSETQTTMAASIPGSDTYPTVYPIVANITLANDGGGSVVKAANPGILGISAAELPIQNLKFDVQFNLNGYAQESKLANEALLGAAAAGSNYGNEILPFAMINEGKIQRTMGDYTVANGHQMKDFYQGGERARE